MSATDFVYDIETYRNLFSCAIVHSQTRTRWIYEVSSRRDQSRHFYQMIHWLRSVNARLVGFNNEAFDWPVCQHLVDLYAHKGHFTAEDAHSKAQAIIDSRDRFAHTLWPNERLVPQIDLFKVHHFDNMARSTSLKKLEIAMRSRRVMDLPYSPHVELTPEQMDEVIAYMCHDVRETLTFFEHSREQIEFRNDLASKYPDMGDVLNFNDTKIGKKFFERELGDALCYQRIDGRRQPRQTIRESIALRDVISPRVRFNHPEFQRVLTWLQGQTLHRADIDSIGVETKGVLKDVSATVDGFTFDFGTGGIHGSVRSQVIRSDHLFDLVDVDVASYYPNLAITNRWFPQHLSETFCDIYLRVYEMRKSHKKGTAENAMLKLALNGVYGDSNNKYSPFFDPQYTMSITVNGQLYLCMLAEKLMAFGCRMVQINTDGLTVLVDKRDRPQFDRTCKEWESHTGLELESVDYAAMYIRDVNSYIAVTTSGKRKRIGAYAYKTPLEDPYTRERQWHQDHSALVIRKAAEAAMVDGKDVAEFIMGHRDPFDFMLAIKVPRSSRLLWGGRQIQNTSRYYVSTDGESLTKIMPPLAGKTEERHFSEEKGWTVSIVNDADQFSWSNVNWLYYIEEARKLIV